MQEQRTIYVISVDDVYHTDDNPFCYTDPHCPCHEDQEAINLVNSWVEQGPITEQEATQYILGRTL